ncbi:MAG: cupin domain-containing protein [Chloroflexota bacterium]
MSDAHVLRIDEHTVIDRGNGISSIPLAGEKTNAINISNGITAFPRGAAIELHTHNTEEAVTLLEGLADCEVNGERHRVKPFDTTYIPAGIPHRFINVGEGPMKILWVYGSTHVTRTFVASGETLGQFGRYDK